MTTQAVKEKKAEIQAQQRQLEALEEKQKNEKRCINCKDFCDDDYFGLPIEGVKDGRRCCSWKCWFELCNNGSLTFKVYVADNDYLEISYKVKGHTIPVWIMGYVKISAFELLAKPK